MEPMPPEPDLEYLEREVGKIKDLSLRTTNIDILKSALVNIFRGFRIEIPSFPAGLKLFRARLLANPPEAISELGCPPPEVSTAQRANRAHQPLLYCSVGREPLFFELQAKAGSTLAIVHYKTTRTLVVSRVGFSDTVFSRLNSTRSVPDYGQIGHGEWSKARHTVDSFLAEAFTQQNTSDKPSKYALSTAIAEKLLNDDFFDGLMYPTVSMFANMENFALKPDVTRAHLESIYVEFLRVLTVDGTRFKYDVLDEVRRIEPDGRIRWRGHPAHWTVGPSRQLGVVAVDGHWEAIDEQGNNVEPL
jgi:hypothetical protein